MLNRVLPVLMVLAVAETGLAMDAAAIREVAAKEHSVEGLLPELKPFVIGREFDVTLTAGAPGAEAQTSPVVKSLEKVVEGRYLVSQYKPPGSTEPVISVMTYEADAEVYRKWTLMPGDVIHLTVGTALPGEGVVSWLRVGRPESDIGFALTVERFEAGKITWREVSFNKQGLVGFIVNGESKKTK